MDMHENARSCPASRALLVNRVLTQGWSVGQAAEAIGVSTRTGYKWLARYRAEGRSGLADRSSRPHRIARSTSAFRVRQIVKLRRRRMCGAEIAARLGMPRSTVARILKREGLNRLKALEPPEPVVRYEKDHPGELVHLDIKKLGRIRGIGHRITGNRRHTTAGIGWEFVHVAIDDASRLAYVEVLRDERKESAVAFLERAVAFYESHGIHVERLMTDNGSCYRSKLFADERRRLGLKHTFTRPYRPRTNGKAERFIQTLLREWAYRFPYRSSRERTRRLQRYLHFYNHHRMHQALHGLPPISRLPRLNNVMGIHS